MLTGAALRIVERAIALQVKRGADVETTVRHYTKLSEEQMTELITKYTAEQAEELGTEQSEQSSKIEKRQAILDIVAELTGMLNIPILILGLLIGFVIKHLVSDEKIQNKYIPVINVVVGAIIGVILAVTAGTAITAEAVLLAVIGGAVSCVSSSGLYDAFSAFVEKGEIPTNPDNDEPKEEVAVG